MNSTPATLPQEGEHEKGRNIFCPALFPCGREIPNRLVKVAMYEHLANMFGGPPNSDHLGLYKLWAQHNWGMIITGNVQVSPTHLTLGRDITLPEFTTESNLLPFRKLAETIHRQGKDSSLADHLPHKCPLAVMQLSHAGRQSPSFLGGRSLFTPSLAPSAIAVGSGKTTDDILSTLFHRLLFPTPHEMSLPQIDSVVEAFVKGAQLALSAGFDGIQLHAAHGCEYFVSSHSKVYSLITAQHPDLIAQFMSPKTNHRLDDYSSEPHKALNFLHRIIISIRAVVPKDFIVGVKLNASDYVDAATNTALPVNEHLQIQKEEQEARALSHVRTIATWQAIDFIEISGGDYETPEFMSPIALSKSPRQAFFANFSRRAVEALKDINVKFPGSLSPLILLTGGLRTPSHLYTALASRHADLLGIGRGSITCPNMPDILMRDEAAGLTNDYTSHAYVPFSLEPQTVLKFWGSESLIGRWIRTAISRVQLVGAGAGMAWYVVMIHRLASHTSENKSGVVHMDYDMGALGAIFRMWVRINWSYKTLTAGMVLLIACSLTWLHLKNIM